ncbi:MAG: sensor domain-containing diguanylate cyclase [Defluviitaleaceae bacterium]|nr:sensor domain-containing diguanylate cyclase [Defluviitaleaceae bacterium]MCL2263048.1 sensor domain-containing diguanylate cyclase [Defluviitaleaceae bacterium]
MNKTFYGFSVKAIILCVLSLILCTFMVIAVVVTRSEYERLYTENFLAEKGMRIDDTLSRFFFKTEVLSALVYYGDGDIVGFETVAPIIVDHPVITNILIAPNGKVSKAYSAYDDVSYLIGMNLFSEEHYGYREARMAYETGELVMSGPFMSPYGHLVLKGILPTYMDLAREDFWGLVAVSLHFPNALANAELDRLRTQGYEYLLWRFDPYTGERQTLSHNMDYADYYSSYIEKPIRFMNAEWYLRLKAIYTWYTDIEIIALIFSGLFISALVLFIAQNNYRLKQTKAELDRLAKTDPLTGIYNRRSFIELAQKDSARARRNNETAYIAIVDADHFKKVNDTHGHLVGDKVLVELATRMQNALRPHDILARYGGEEFIIYLPNLSRDMAEGVAERIRAIIQDTPFDAIDCTLPVTVSMGVAPYSSDSIEKAIKQADDALYNAKEGGRNQVIFTG